ncbi:hypothetical protein TRIATDRAFT_298551, partial [Trichoderma atroviride IMI 206040]
PRFGYFLDRFQKEETPKKKKRERDYTYTLGSTGIAPLSRGGVWRAWEKQKFWANFFSFPCFFPLFLFLDKAINLARALQPAKPLHGYSA